MDQKMVYSEKRGTWNLFVNGEWYFEGTYEQCSDMMFNNACDWNDDQDDYYEDPYPYDEY